MRIVYGKSVAGARKAEGQSLQSDASDEHSEQNQASMPARPVRPITRLNGERIRFRELAIMAFPKKTDANLAFVARVDARTVRRWLADDTEPPAPVLGIILAEIMRRFHQR